MIKDALTVLSRILPRRLADRFWVRTIRRGLAEGLKLSGTEVDPAYLAGTNERPLQEALKAHLRAGDVVYDIGANIGFFTLISARLVGPTGRVLAFEPVPENAAAIRRNAQVNRFRNVEVIERAVAGAPGRGDLLCTEHCGGATLAATGIVPPDVTCSRAVDLVSVDDLVGRIEIPPPSLVKIDVEGAELAVLAGMKRTAETYAPILLYEVDDEDQALFRARRTEIDGQVESLGYTVTHLENGYPGATWHIGHAVAVPRPSRARAVHRI